MVTNQVSLIKYFSRVQKVLLFTACCFNVRCGSSEKREDQIKFQQYFIKGEQLYKTHCSNCHQQDGSGLGLLYPPLRQSDYMKQNKTDVICLIRFGKEGEITVNGQIYNKSMPAFPVLSDLEVAQISTYIYNTWEHKEGMISVKQVSEILRDCQK
jgi:cytochrome c551